MSEHLTEHAYWTEIREIAESIASEVRAENPDARASDLQDAAYERLLETIDSHQWVIYTHYNHQVLAISPNDGYAISEWGSDGIVENGALRTDRLTFGAMFGDCLEELGKVDWNEAPAEEEARS